jgi:hypothetical protein
LKWIFVLPVLLGAGISAAGSLVYRAGFDTGNLDLEPVSGTTALELPGCMLRGAPGAPLMPAASFVFVIPAGADVTSVRALPSNPSPVRDAGVIEPAPVLRPLGEADGASVRTFSELIYGSAEPWPGDVLIGTHSGRLCGFTVVSCLIQPFEYIPLSGELRLYESVELEITWEDGAVQPLTEAQFTSAVWRLSHLVLNPEDLNSCAPPVRGSTVADVEHLIVCDGEFVDEFQLLADYHTGTGRPSAVLPVQEIMTAYPGADDPERLRNCLTDYWQNSGTVSVLLAGDETVLPTRFVNTQCEGWFSYAPVDLYFSDLDGTWDGNGDGDYGQPDDDLDLYADLLVGRAPFRTSADAQTFVGKTLLYMTDPPTGNWYREAVLCGSVLFEEQGYIAARGCDSIAAVLPASWEIIKAYEILYGTYIDTHIQYITDGSGWTHYAGHGNERGIYWHDQGKGMMTTWIADTLWNGDRTGIHSSIACHPGAYQEETECLAEVLLNRPDRGGVAVLFNTSYGWEGYWPNIGPSERMCADVVRGVFYEKAPSLGLAFASSKDRIVPWMHGEYDRVFQSLLSWTAFHDPPLPVLGVPEMGPIPPEPLLMSAPWPNPATRDAPIAFDVLFEESPVRVSVHDLYGRLMWSADVAAGARAVWDGFDPAGSRVPAGVYIISASWGDIATSRKVTVLN